MDRQGLRDDCRQYFSLCFYQRASPTSKIDAPFALSCLAKRRRHRSTVKPIFDIRNDKIGQASFPIVASLIGDGFEQTSIFASTPS